MDIVQCIKENSAGIRNTPGTALENSAGQVLYTPPTGERLIRDKMSDLQQFINDTGTVDPLIKMALLHDQFEAIHPFSDNKALHLLEEIVSFMEKMSLQIKDHLPAISKCDTLVIL